MITKFSLKPGTNNDGDDDSVDINISTIPGCSQYFEKTSGSEFLLTLPVDPHLPNIVYIKTRVDKAIPADATVSSRKLNSNFIFRVIINPGPFVLFYLDKLGIWSHTIFI